MSNVTILDDHRPHEFQYVACMDCGHDWVAVSPCDLEHKLECSECGNESGEAVNGGDTKWLQRFMSASLGHKNQKKRTLVLLNEKRMRDEGVL